MHGNICLLQVMNRSGEYQAATPVDGAVLVNIGDMMQRWTADSLVSTVCVSTFVSLILCFLNTKLWPVDA